MINWKFILSVRAFILFYVLFFFLLIIMIFTKMNMVMFNGTIILICLLFLTRVLNRRLKLNKLDFFYLNEKNYKNDSLQRGEQIGDIFAIVLFIIIALDVNAQILTKFGNSAISFVGFCVLVFLPIASISISKNNKILKVITILLTTFYGLFVFLVTLTTVLIIITGFLNGNKYTDLQNLFSILNTEDIILLGFIVEEYILQIILFIIGSIVLLLIFIFYTPPYQLEDLGESLKIANLVIILISVCIFFYANVSGEKISTVIQSIDISEYTSIEEEEQKFLNYVEKFSKNNVINLGYVLLLPYILSITIANLVIDILKRKYKRKATKALESIIESANIRDIDEFLKKKFIYNGGEKHNLKLIECLKLNQADLSDRNDSIG